MSFAYQVKIFLVDCSEGPEWMTVSDFKSSLLHTVQVFALIMINKLVRSTYHKHLNSK